MPDTSDKPKKTILPDIPALRVLNRVAKLLEGLEESAKRRWVIDGLNSLFPEEEKG